MSTKNDLFSAGNSILNAVADAIERNDYSNLNQDVKSVVADTLRNVGQPERTQYKEEYPQNQPTYQRQRPVYFKDQTPFLQRTTNAIADWVKMGLGFAGTVFFGIFDLASIAVTIGEQEAIGVGVGIGFVTVLTGLTIGSILLMKQGFDGKSLKDRYQLYGTFIGNREFYDLATLARQTGRKLADVQKDMVKLMRTGVLPQARMDVGQTTLMLTERSFRQYEQAESARRLREQEEAKTQENLDPSISKEIAEILEEGNAYLKTIHSCNDQIPDANVSSKLFELEEIMNRIFDQVKKNPESADKLHRFMNYYLPTTTKLLYAYIDLDKQPSEGTNVQETKRQIEETLDTINDGFKNLLDSLFQEMAWDISSDINVMKTMMQQDGLTSEGRISEN